MFVTLPRGDYATDGNIFVFIIETVNDQHILTMRWLVSFSNSSQMSIYFRFSQGPRENFKK